MAVKFVRIAFNKEELEFLLDSCKTNYKLHRKLRKALIGNDWDEETFVLKNDSPIIAKPLTSIREQAYNKWCSDPSSCTSEEMQQVTDYRYFSGLMDEQEREDYETLLNSKFGEL